jgi:hypothetical protein
MPLRSPAGKTSCAQGGCARKLDFCWGWVSLSAGQSTAPPKNGPGVSQAHVIFNEGLNTPPPKNGPGPRGLRAHAVSAHPQPVRPPRLRALVAGVPVGVTHVAAVPGTPAVCVEASSTRPTSVRPAAGLRRCVRRTSRLGLFPPRTASPHPQHALRTMVGCLAVS